MQQICGWRARFRFLTPKCFRWLGVGPSNGLRSAQAGANGIERFQLDVSVSQKSKSRARSSFFIKNRLPVRVFGSPDGKKSSEKLVFQQKSASRSTFRFPSHPISSDVSQNEQLTVGVQGLDSYVIHVVCYGLPPPECEFWRGPRQHPRNMLTI